jgi:hypothetical protein
LQIAHAGLKKHEISMRHWNLPILRFGQPQESLESRTLVHFVTGDRLSELSQANPGLLAQDGRSAQRARDALREISCRLLVQMIQKAADLFLNATLPIGEVPQSPDEFVRAQSGTTRINYLQPHEGNLMEFLFRSRAVQIFSTMSP